jgi:hypothetical protein
MNSASTCAAAVTVFIAGSMTGWLLHRTGVNQVVAEGEVTRLSANNGSERDVPNATPETKDVEFETRIHDLVSRASFSKRSRAIARIADGMNARQIRQALETLKTRSVRDADQIRLRLLERWAELEPEAALRYAEALSQGGDAQRAIPAVIRVWGGKDAKAAEEAVERMADGFAKQIARGEMVSVLAASDPHRAFALFQQSRLFNDNISALFGSWAEKNPDEAAAHALKLRADWQRSIALEIVAEKWNKSDRDGALAWAQSLPLIPGEGVTIERRDPKPLAAVLKTWFSEDAESALRWLEQQPDSTMKTDALAVLSKDLGNEDPQHAVEAAAMMPSGKAQESALNRSVCARRSIGWSVARTGGRADSSALATGHPRLLGFQRALRLHQVIQIPNRVDQIRNTRLQFTEHRRAEEQHGVIERGAFAFLNGVVPARDWPTPSLQPDICVPSQTRVRPVVYRIKASRPSACSSRSGRVARA